jgi:hypothetical protein
LEGGGRIEDTGEELRNLYHYPPTASLKTSEKFISYHYKAGCQQLDLHPARIEKKKTVY